jgi:TPR repeat protein
VTKPKKKRHLNALKEGHELHWYEIREVLGQGGFGITYLAQDKNLDHEVAIKEYLPSDLAIRTEDNTLQSLSSDHDKQYNWGLRSFIDEARTLGQFKHPNIVRVRNVFEANNTAYMIMDYELGETLQDILNRRKILEQDDVETVIFPIIDGMKTIHAHGFIHRDIKPANIFIRVDGDPVLLDFGSARQSLEESQGTITSIFSKGYAPIEQYNTSEDQQGPWTDIYALGATMYRTISGIPPCDAVDRSSAISMTGRDTYVTAEEIGEGRYTNSLLEAIDHAMKFKKEDRPQTISEWQTHFHSKTSDIKVDEIPIDEEVEEVNDADTFKLELEKAVAGDVNAQSNIAFMYAKGINCDRNDGEAAKWYAEAASQGHLNSQYNLGVLYAKGRGVDQNYAKSFKWYLKAAEQGDTNAQSTVAMMYLKGVGTEKSPEDALTLYKLSAESGNVNSMYNLADMVAKGLGTKKDYKEAVEWYKRAADHGHVNAQVNLGFMYGKGQGVVRDDTEAYHWYRKAAESGHPNAQFNLGVIYSKGRGIPKNIEEAMKWYQKAYDQGDENAKKSLEKLQMVEDTMNQ